MGKVLKIDCLPGLERKSKNRMVPCKEPSCKSEATYGFRFAQPEYCRLHGLQNNAITQYQICKCGEDKNTELLEIHSLFFDEVKKAPIITS